MATALSVLLVAVGAASGWVGLGWLIWTLPPDQPLALAEGYALAFLAITCSGALAAWAALRPRLQSGRLASPLGYLGHAMLLAVITLFALWLQSLRMLTPLVSVLLVGVYGLLELAVLFGTRGSVELPLDG